MRERLTPGTRKPGPGDGLPEIRPGRLTPGTRKPFPRDELPEISQEDILREPGNQARDMHSRKALESFQSATLTQNNHVYL
jgi:hypothetical protein